MSDDSIDVLIITALREELDALLEVEAGRVSPWTRVDGDPPYHRAHFDGKHGTIRVAATRLTKMGGIETASVANSLVHRLAPSCIAMCGVCAGHPDETDLGDVIIADRVFQYDFGKRGVNEFRADLSIPEMQKRWLHEAQEMEGSAFDMHGYATPSEPIEHAKWWFLEKLYPVDVATDQERRQYTHNPLKSVALRRYIPDSQRVEILTRLADELGLVTLSGGTYSLTAKGRAELETHRTIHGMIITACPYHIWVGPIGSGNTVVADNEAWDVIRKNGMRKTLGIEMEAAAIGKVATDYEIAFAVVKGVMDHGDPKKTDRFKRFAARASAEVLCSLLRRVVEPSADEGVEGRVLQPSSSDVGLRKGRDSAKIAELLYGLNHIVIEEMIQVGPKRISYRALWFWETYNHVWSSRSTHVYHDGLRELFAHAHRAWHTALKYHQFYDSVQHGNDTAFVWREPPAETTSERKAIHKESQAAQEEVRAALDDLGEILARTLKIVRENFVEIDIDEIARRSLRDWQKDSADQPDVDEAQLPPRASEPLPGPESSENSFGRLSNRFFVVGAIAFSMAVGLGLWGFGIGDLTDDQRQILRWTFSLASGFAVGAFTGGFVIKSFGNILASLAGTATGGFAVWLITFLSLFLPPSDGYNLLVEFRQSDGRPARVAGRFVVVIGAEETGCDPAGGTTCRIPNIPPTYSGTQMNARLESSNHQLIGGPYTFEEDGNITVTVEQVDGVGVPALGEARVEAEGDDVRRIAHTEMREAVENILHPFEILYENAQFGPNEVPFRGPREFYCSPDYMAISLKAPAFVSAWDQYQLQGSPSYPNVYPDVSWWRFFSENAERNSTRLDVIVQKYGPSLEAATVSAVHHIQRDAFFRRLLMLGELIEANDNNMSIAHAFASPQRADYDAGELAEYGMYADFVDKIANLMHKISDGETSWCEVSK